MKHLLVRYKVKQEALSEHRSLIEAAFDALQDQAPEDISYMAVELGDGNFVHLKTDLTEGAFDLSDLPAFQDFTRGIKERCEEQPQFFSDARVLGNYRMTFG
jgi:hypothetical protein